MRTDLKLNYGKLREVRGEISEYRQSLERVDNGLENLKRFLAGQESEAVDKLNKKLSDVTINIRDKIETLQLLEETLEDYVDDMERLVKAEGGGITRVDTWDISFNLSQIHAAVRDSFLPMTRSVNGMPHFSLIEDEEEKEKKKKRERNYNRLERFRSSDIMSLKRRVERHLEDLQDIYKNYLKPYEKLDDTYRSRLNKIYSSHTSAGDKWANFWDGFASVADSFITAFAIAAVTAFIAAITPAWLAVAGVVLLGVGVAVMANIPEESVPDWLKPVKKGADGIADKAVKMLKEGPASVVEDIGQGLMDEIQTPEGIASVAGGTVGTLAGGYAGSRVNSALKVEKGSSVGGEAKKTRLPRSNGEWKGEPGNGKWFSNKPEVQKITKGEGVKFVNGRPNFSPWSKGKLKFKKGVLNGSQNDFNNVYDKIKQVKGLSSRNQAKIWLKEKGLTPHHKSPTEIELIPTDLHKNIPHIGSAADLRGGN